MSILLDGGPLLLERFIARQPILDDRLQLYGYELLFRVSRENNIFVAEPHATAQVVASSTMVFSWDALIGPTRAFINCSTDELLDGVALLMPKKKTVIEITESVELNADVIRACTDLQNAGYTLAIDGFRDLPEQRPLVGLVDYLKVDFRNTSEEQQTVIGKKYSKQAVKLVAKKVANWSEYARARSLHFALFQGFFFLEPQILRRTDVPGTKANSLRLLQVVQRSPLDQSQVEVVLKQDPALTYKLLRYLNSPLLARRAEVRSIPNAIMLLGEEDFRRWATVAAVVTSSAGKPGELIRTALVRAFFCEEIAKRLNCKNSYEFFLVGLLSVMNAILERSLSDIVAELAVSEEVRAALEGENNILRTVFDAVLAYEQGDWLTFADTVDHLSLPEEKIPDCFVAADHTATSLMV